MGGFFLKKVLPLLLLFVFAATHEHEVIKKRDRKETIDTWSIIKLWTSRVSEGLVIIIIIVIIIRSMQVYKLRS